MESTSSLSPSNPCYFLQEALKAFFKCLGIESNKTQDEAATSAFPSDHHSYPPTEDPKEMVITTRAGTGLTRGSGGQTF